MTNKYNEICNEVINFIIDRTIGKDLAAVTIDNIQDSVNVVAAVSASCVMAAATATTANSDSWLRLFHEAFELNLKNIQESLFNAAASQQQQTRPYMREKLN